MNFDQIEEYREVAKPWRHRHPFSHENTAAVLSFIVHGDGSSGETSAMPGHESV